MEKSPSENPGQTHEIEQQVSPSDEIEETLLDSKAGWLQVLVAQ